MTDGPNARSLFHVGEPLEAPVCGSDVQLQVFLVLYLVSVPASFPVCYLVSCPVCQKVCYRMVCQEQALSPEKACQVLPVKACHSPALPKVLTVWFRKPTVLMQESTALLTDG